MTRVLLPIAMVNGNGMMHGGCIAYLIDKCVFLSPLLSYFPSPTFSTQFWYV